MAVIRRRGPHGVQTIAPRLLGHWTRTGRVRVAIQAGRGRTPTCDSSHGRPRQVAGRPASVGCSPHGSCPSAIVLTSALVAGALVSTRAADADAQRAGGRTSSFLASDDLQGRDTGSEGHKKAAAYVAEQFKAAGLAPAGTSGYLQPVQFTSRKIVEAQSSLALVRDGQVEPVALGPDAAFSMRIDPAPQVEAPLAFVGYGLSIPELKIDDLAGQDLRGKVAVYLLGSPARRARRAERARAVGCRRAGPR